MYKYKRPARRIEMRFERTLLLCQPLRSVSLTIVVAMAGPSSPVYYHATALGLKRQPAAVGITCARHL